MENKSEKIGIDFNNVRHNLLLCYSELCNELNNSIHDNQNIILDPKRIKSNMDQIRIYFGIIAAANLEDREDFKSVGSEIMLPILNVSND